MVSFPNLCDLNGHMCKTHGRLRLARNFSQGSQCYICLRELWTRSKLMKHYHEDSNVCLLNLAMRYPRLSDEVIEMEKALQAEHESNNRKNGVNFHACNRRPVQAEGPLQRVMLDTNHNKQSKYPHWRRCLQDAYVGVRAPPKCVFERTL